ncbi:MAG: NAD(P)H-dependent oxidoreductase subunit E [Clostridia bacterium]|nr:NAD(P)H-dependent oxidoreductase subunit E [Clostridia bacterium]
MQKKISNLPFKGTPEQEQKLQEVIASHKHDKSLLMAVMQKAQDIYGYLPMEVQTMIAEGMDVPLEKVYGVATFYAQFSLTPKGKYNISVCLGTACYVKGAGDIFDKFSEKLGIAADECTADGKFSLTACRCIGACGLAPVLTVNEDVYGRLTVDDVDDILAKYQD